MQTRGIIGIDFDNTLAGYDLLFQRLARAEGLVPEGFQGGKQAVRDTLRQRPGGEKIWQRLQGQAYGKHMAGAELLSGAGSFLQRCSQTGLPVHIVSHKTRFGHHDSERVDLRQAALRWMEKHGFFDSRRLGLDSTCVWFEETRAAKLVRISQLGCAIFIDDLPELFAEPAFPPGVERWLYAPNGVRGVDGIRVFRHWDEITHALFGR